MTYKFLAAAAMSLSLASTGAFAQTAQPGAQPGADGTMAGHDRMPAEWEGRIGDAFYSDTALGTLRDEDERRAAWDDLDEDDQTAVRDYCERFMEDDQAMLGGAAGEPAQPGTQGGEAPAQAATGTGATGTQTQTGTTGTTGAAGTGTGTAATGTATGTTTGTATGTGAATGTAAGTGAATGTAAGTGAATGTGTAATGVQTSAEAMTHQASLRQICEMIEDDNG